MQYKNMHTLNPKTLGWNYKKKVDLNSANTWLWRSKFQYQVLVGVRVPDWTLGERTVAVG